MTKFRKKPIIVEAFQWTEDITPQWWRVVSNDFKINPATGSVFITTLEGIMEAKPRDFIVRGIKGELYPVKEPIFRETYEEIKMNQSSNIKTLEELKNRFIESVADERGYLHHLSKEKRNWLRNLIIEVANRAYEIGKKNN